MKKVLAILVLAALMVASLGKGGVSSMANAYTDFEGALPALPAE